MNSSENLETIVSSFLTVIVSELGDKTFISTAMLAMKYYKSAVFIGNIASMTFMMTIAAYIGYTVMIMINPHYVKILSIIAFLHFSTISFWEAYKTSKEEDEDIKIDSHKKEWISVLWQTMVLVFFAEWGDKSQIGIIAMSATHPLYLVMIGAIVAILVCAAIAIIFGKIFTGYISESLMGYLSGFVFLFFAIMTLKDYILEGN